MAGNPLKYIDPSGHGWFTDQLIALGQRSEVAKGMLVSVAEIAQSISDPVRSPSMEGIRQTVGKGVEAVGMASAVKNYTIRAASEGRWDDAARGISGGAQMGGAVIAKSPEMAKQFAVGVVVGPFVNAWEFGESLREYAAGERSGWDVAYHGFGVAATLLGTGRTLGQVRAARLAAAKQASLDPANIAGKSPSEIDGIAQRAGLIAKGPNPQMGQGSYIDPVTGNQRVLIHPYDTVCGPHCHVNNIFGQRLDINGNIVSSPNLPDAHLPIKFP
ncbi:MAG: hypothetical protein GY833_09685 [Aestuariibacter sp.]|nr:hypothetical protein [Aestuariibacter sp.]